MSYEDSISAEIERWKGATVRFETGGKHMRAIIKYRDKEQFVTYPTTGSDGRRGALNCIGEVRRTLTALGARRDVQPKAAQPKRTPNPGARLRELVTTERAPVRPDPFEALRSVTFASPDQTRKPSRWTRLRAWLAFWK